MKLGIWLPVVHRTPPYVPPAWELAGRIDEVAAIAAAAESLGYEYLFAPEHIALPVSKAHVRGEVYWDPISTLGYVAAHTKKINLVPLVLVASYHHPLEIAKRMGTLDRISGGRAAIGIGVGSLAEEFELLGANMKERGRRTDDMLRALHAARGVRVPKYEGEFYRFSDMVVDPGLRKDIPIWVGGLSDKSVGRAIEYADVWSPTRMPIEKVKHILSAPETQAKLAARNRHLDVCYVMSEDFKLDAVNEPQQVRAYLGRLKDAGVTVFAPELVNTTVDIYIDQLRATAEIARSY